MTNQKKIFHPLRILSALLILVIWIWGIRITEKQAVAADGPSRPHPGVSPKSAKRPLSLIAQLVK